jgi:hypothetical protein
MLSLLPVEPCAVNTAVGDAGVAAGTGFGTGSGPDKALLPLV